VPGYSVLSAASSRKVLDRRLAPRRFYHVQQVYRGSRELRGSLVAEVPAPHVATGFRPEQCVYMDYYRRAVFVA